MRLLILTCALYSLVFSPSSMADKVYRWVDSNGQTHFGNRAPESGKAEEISVKPIQTTELTPIKTKEESESKDDKNEIIYTIPASVTDDQAKQYCQNAKKQKQLLKGDGSRRFQQADGSIRTYTDEEQRDLLSKIEEMIKVYCN